MLLFSTIFNISVVVSSKKSLFAEFNKSLYLHSHIADFVVEFMPIFLQPELHKVIFG